MLVPLTTPAQTPLVQTSPTVSGLPSSQAVLSAFTGFEQMPPVQTPASWHWSSAVQITGFPPVQTPAWQVSVWLQAFPSSQAVLSAFAGFEQTPPVQTPTSWH